MSSVLRKSGRLSTKAAIVYTEKKIPIQKKAKITKKETKVDTLPAKIKVEKKVNIKTVTATDIANNRPSEVFDLLHEMHLENAIKHMKEHDPKLGAYLDEVAIRDFKERLNRADGSNPFRSLTQSIVYQQIHGKAAASIYDRFLKLFTKEQNENVTNWFPTPDQVLAKSVDELRSAGLSGRKVEYIQNLASKFKDNSITPEKFNSMSDEEISAQLCAVKGIGQWTVDMFLMLDLHHSDVLPLGDLAVRKGVANHFGLPTPADKKKIFPLPHHMTQLTEVWRPYRSLGSWLMWRISNIKVVGDK